MSHCMTKPTKWPVHPAKTPISLGICPVWSVLTVRLMGSRRLEVSSCGQRKLGRPGWSESLLGAYVTLLVYRAAAQLWITRDSRDPRLLHEYNNLQNVERLVHGRTRNSRHYADMQADQRFWCMLTRTMSWENLSYAVCKQRHPCSLISAFVCSLSRKYNRVANGYTQNFKILRLTL